MITYIYNIHIIHMITYNIYIYMYIYAKKKSICIVVNPMVSLHLNTSAWSIPHFSGKIGHGVQCSLPQFFDRQSIMLFPMSFSFSGPVQVHAGAKSVLGHQYVLKRLEAP